MKNNRSEPLIIASDAAQASAGADEWPSNPIQDSFTPSPGVALWRALHELLEGDDLQEQLQASFPQFAAAAPVDRRNFLKFLGASLALAGASGCSAPPAENIVPWVHGPADGTRVLPQFYATALESAGFGVGVLVKSNSGRPTKIEGNPAHPDSLGATNALLQAAVLQVWDPDRSQTPLHQGATSSWDAFSLYANGLFKRFHRDGRRLRVLSGHIASPTLASQRDDFLQRFPGAKWHQYEAIDHEQTLAGARLVFGRPLLPRYHFDKARVILSLDADFLGTMPGHLRYARDFADGRRKALQGEMNRLYTVEPTPSLTGANADHRWPLDCNDLSVFAQELARELGVAGFDPSEMPAELRQRVQAVADDLRANAGTSLVLVGETQPAQIHAIAHVINETLGNTGSTVSYLEPFDPPSDTAATSLAALTADMHAGQVEALLILGVNPVYDAAIDLEFAGAIGQVTDTIHLGLYFDETAHACKWHIPQAHPLESWSDIRAWDGTVSLVQPLLQPLYGGRTAHEVVAGLLDDNAASRDIVRAFWRERFTGDFEQAWAESLRKGLIENTGQPPAELRPDQKAFAQWTSEKLADKGQGELELLFRPDPSIWDGRHANNGWLQELPRPLSQLTWSNAALVAPALASQYGLTNGDVIELSLDGRKLKAPIWIMPGQAPRSITLHLGYGRTRAGQVGNGVGVNAYLLRNSKTPWHAQGLTIRSSGERQALPSTQSHFRMEGREPVQRLTQTALLAGLSSLKQNEASPSFYPARNKGEHSWGMQVDLNTCIGCKACTIACQAENNIPVVGPDQVSRGREMHWIRVDRYYEGDPDAPMTYHQPVPCMHCEDAPCELVCPVGATVHDSEGLNLQVYNRCIGTRFCSNNCPYKVRRFNFLQYSDLGTESLKGQRNPDVTVRNRGVMEKCTYCVQRIQEAHIQASKDDRSIADGDIVTACQSACPTQAITFGDMNDPDSSVSQAKASPLDYLLLGELNTRPHTSYGAHVRNPNPALENPE